MQEININARMDIHAPYIKHKKQQVKTLAKGETFPISCKLVTDFDKTAQIWLLFGQDYSTVEPLEITLIEYFEPADEQLLGATYYEKIADPNSESGYKFVEQQNYFEGCYTAVDARAVEKMVCDDKFNWQLDSNCRFIPEENCLIYNLPAELSSNQFVATDEYSDDDYITMEVVQKIVIEDDNNDDVTADRYGMIITSTEKLKCIDSLFSKTVLKGD